MSAAPHYLVHDYWKEPYDLLRVMNESLSSQGIFFFANPDSASDEELVGALTAARKDHKVRTIEERFLDPSSAQRYVDLNLSHMQEWIGANSDSVTRAAQLANILNTTEDVMEFKRAINEVHNIVYGKNEPWFKVPPLPVSAPRTQEEPTLDL